VRAAPAAGAAGRLGPAHRHERAQHAAAVPGRDRPHRQPVAPPAALTALQQLSRGCASDRGRCPGMKARPS
jgi:hypothetical protein